MDILHLTDLHVTAPNTTLESVWVTVFDQLRAAKRTKFDFIVVSGDLTQSAQRQQYDDLARFAKNVLRLLLRVNDKRRIIFVPGNHDVEWGRPQALRSVKGLPSSEELRELATHPHSSRVRTKLSADGALQFVRRDPKQYGSRFTAVQRFLQTFYGANLPDDHRSFDLTNQHPEGHWSAHVFASERVAFYGFNSCFHNDAYWRGATLEEEAVTGAVAHAREHADGMQWIAVWHHGLISERGQPDHLVTRDLGMLRFAGFAIGVHGHTHADEFGDQREILGARFPIVATGSFAAGPSERPEGTLNQFSVLELSRSYLIVDRFERKPTLEWHRRRLAPYSLEVSVEPPLNTAERHSRVFILDLETGFAEVAVEFTDLDVNQELILAEPMGALLEYGDVSDCRRWCNR